MCAVQCAQKAAYAARRIAEIEGFSLPFSAPRFNEFVVRAPGNAAELLSRLRAEHGINGGLPLSRYFPDRPNDFLVCVTETNTRAEIDASEWIGGDFTKFSLRMQSSGGKPPFPTCKLEPVQFAQLRSRDLASWEGRFTPADSMSRVL